MALFDFWSSTLRVLKNNEFVAEQIQALRQCLPIVHRLQQPQPPARAIHDEIDDYRKLALPLRQRLNTHPLLVEANPALRIAGELIVKGFRGENDAANDSDGGDDPIERMATHLDSFCDALAHAKSLAPDPHSGRPAMWDADWETLRVIHQQLDLGYEEARKNGHGCERVEPSAAVGSKFSMAVEACLVAVGVNRDLDEVCAAYASQWRAQGDQSTR